MRSLPVVLLVMIVVLSGCGGGGGGAVQPELPPGTLAASPDGKVALTGSSAAVPTGVVLAVWSKQATELTPPPSGSAFVAGAVAQPAGTQFGGPVTLSFALSTPLASGETVDLFQYTGGAWQQVGTAVAVSADRRTVTAQISAVSADGQFALLRI